MTVDWAYTVAISVFAFSRSGAAGVGLVTLLDLRAAGGRVRAVGAGAGLRHGNSGADAGHGEEAEDRYDELALQVHQVLEGSSEQIEAAG